MLCVGSVLNNRLSLFRGSSKGSPGAMSLPLSEFFLHWPSQSGGVRTARHCSIKCEYECEYLQREEYRTDHFVLILYTCSAVQPFKGHKSVQ